MNDQGCHQCGRIQWNDADANRRPFLGRSCPNARHQLAKYWKRLRCSFWQTNPLCNSPCDGSQRPPLWLISAWPTSLKMSQLSDTLSTSWQLPPHFVRRWSSRYVCAHHLLQLRNVFFLNAHPAWRSIPLSKWLITMVIVSPQLTGVVGPLPNGRTHYMAYKWGWSDHYLCPSWDDPPRNDASWAY